MSDLPNVVEILYKREGKEETFTGTITVDGKAGITFAGVTFDQILEFASESLRDRPEHRLMMKREEAPYPMVMPTGFENLLRTNLQAAIDMLTVLPRRVEVGLPKAKRVYTGLRHGHDTLADSLGEEVYLRARSGSHGTEVEDPITGRWKPALAVSSQLTRVGELSITFANTRSWALVKTEELLTVHSDRYYLPRRWNPSEGWISHDLLAYMYDMYRKEKSDVVS